MDRDRLFPFTWVSSSKWYTWYTDNIQRLAESRKILEVAVVINEKSWTVTGRNVHWDESAVWHVEQVHGPCCTGGWQLGQQAARA